MALPNFQSDDRTFQMMQSSWISQLNPVLANPVTNPLILKNISLAVGANTINHRLGKQQQGWFITDIDGLAEIYRSQPFNDKTLTLTSDAAVTVNLVVF